jgi:S1-C subfamily serine protease
VAAVSPRQPRVILRGVPFDDDAEADAFRFRPPPHPDDRLWRHPSELGSRRNEGAGERDRQAGRPWGVVAVAGTAGAVLAGAGVLALGLGERVVERPVVERVALDTVSSTPRAADQAGNGIRQQVAAAVVAVEGGGSGIVVRDDGIVLTSASVVDGSGPVNVRLPDGSSVEAEVLGADLSTGIAVLDLDGNGYRTGLLASEAGLVQGQMSFTVSVGAGGATTAAALVGTTRRYRSPTGTTIDAVVETTGDSPSHALGGPLVSGRGVVVGIVTGVDDGQASYVVPVEVARKVAGDLVATGQVERCWLGIDGSDAGDPGVAGGGVMIAEVKPDSPADRAGLRAGDVVVEVDGRMIGHLPDLMITLRSRSPEDEIAVTVVRDDNPTTLTVTLGRQRTVT